VPQTAGRARLVQKPGSRELVVDEVGMDHLDGYRSAERDLLRAVHAAHASDPDHVRDAITAR
jgi:hypothetical protein